MTKLEKLIYEAADLGTRYGLGHIREEDFSEEYENIFKKLNQLKQTL